MLNPNSNWMFVTGGKCLRTFLEESLDLLFSYSVQSYMVAESSITTKNKLKLVTEPRAESMTTST